jgi:hypothetical protein
VGVEGKKVLKKTWAKERKGKCQLEFVTLVSQNPHAGREVAAPSIINQRNKIQGGEEVPPDGGVIRPHDAPVEPFFSKVKFDASKSVLVLGGPLGSNGLPTGHADFNSGHPGLSENRFEGELIIKVLSTSLSPETIDNETM